MKQREVIWKNPEKSLSRGLFCLQTQSPPPPIIKQRDALGKKEAEGSLFKSLFCLQKPSLSFHTPPHNETAPRLYEKPREVLI